MSARIITKAIRIITRFRAGAFCLALVLLLPITVWAHPLDEYLQSTYLTLTPDAVEIEIDLTPGLLVTSEVIALIDRDGDGELSESEGESYALSVVDELRLTIDDEPQTLRLTSFQMPELLLLEAGAGVIEVKVQADFDSTLGTHQLVYHNQHQPVKSKHQVNPLLPPDPALSIEQQKRDDTGQQIEMTYTVAAAGQLEEDEQETSLAIEDKQEQALEDLPATTSTPQLLLVALALMLLLVLGGLLVMVRRTLWGS